MTTSYRDFSTAATAAPPGFGTVRIARNEQGISHCLFFDPQALPPPPPGWQDAGNDPLIEACRQLLDSYFHSGRLGKTVPLAPTGTDFQRQVWRQLEDIPDGLTLTYGEVAQRIGRPTAVRAVAGAIARNPVCILIPCHRVIGGKGALTGYAWGLERKAALLKLEGALN